MQLDMHYYGTYAIARAGGLNQETARIVATCAQFVDDNAAKTNVTFRDGSRIDAEATAHHAIDTENLDDEDQRRVWVPFHFLPGNQGESYTERLKCRKDSAIAREMFEHHLGLADRAFAPALVGIAAHVYADTFSHYGFSGVSSRGNKIDNDSFKFHEEVEGVEGTVAHLSPEMRTYISDKAAAFFAKPNDYHGGFLDNIVSWFGEAASGALGHGAVATFPDRPYLVWSFEYERADFAAGGTTSVRNNPVTFFEGCRALHGMFRRFAAARPDLYDAGDAREFDDIREPVLAVLSAQGSKEDRIAVWQEAAQRGSVFGTPGESIPDYAGETWNAQWEDLEGSDSYHAATETSIWRFYQAAALHRTYVIRDLLPKYDLVVN